MDFWKDCRRCAWVIGALIGMFLLGLGASEGQFNVIWKKAVIICLECIGIG